MSNSSEYGTPSKSNFEIRSKLKSNFLSVNEGASRELMPCEAAHQKLSSNPPEKAERARQQNGHRLSGSKHIHRFSVIAEMECAVFARSPPDALFSECDIEVA